MEAYARVCEPMRRPTYVTSGSWNTETDGVQNVDDIVVEKDVAGLTNEDIYCTYIHRH